MNLERLDYTQYATKKDKIFLRSQGRCICNSNEQRKNCLNYEHKDNNCKHLDKILGFTCLWREGTHE